MQLTPTESKPELRFNFGMVPPIVIMIIGVTATTYSTLDGATRLQGDVQGLGLTLMLICLLACCSWYSMESGVHGVNRRWAFVAGYILAFLGCFFFSFTSYMENNSESSGAVYANFERTLISFGQIPVGFQGQLRDVLRNKEKELRESALIKNYVDRMIQLDKELRVQSNDIIVEQINEEQKNSRRVERNKRDLLLSRIRDKQFELESNTNLKDIKQKELDQKRDALAKLEDGVSVANAALAEEIDTAKTSKLSKDGPASKILPQVLNCTVKRDRGIGTCSKSINKFLRKSNAERKKLRLEEKNIVQSIARFEILISDNKADLLILERDEKEQSLLIDKQSEVNQSTPTKELFLQSVYAFENLPSRALLTSLEDNCNVYAGIIKPDDSRLCSSAQIFPLFDELEQFKAKLMSLEESCKAFSAGLEIKSREFRSNARAFGRVTPLIHNEAFDFIQEKIINPCLEKAKNSNFSTEGLIKEVADFRAINDPNVDKINFTLGRVYNVITMKGESQHYLAFFFAFFQELMLLAAKFFWDKSQRRSFSQEVDFSEEDIAAAGLLLESCVEKNGGLVFNHNKYIDKIDNAQKPLVENLMYTLERAGCVSLIGFFRKRKLISPYGRDLLYG